MATYVRFEQGLMDQISDELGPYEYVQIVYNGIWTPDYTREIAYYSHTGLWVTNDDRQWSDVVIYAK